MNLKNAYKSNNSKHFYDFSEYKFNIFILKEFKYLIKMLKTSVIRFSNGFCIRA